MPFVDRDQENRIAAVFTNRQNPDQEWIDDDAKELVDFKTAAKNPGGAPPSVEEQLAAIWELLTPEQGSDAEKVKQKAQAAYAKNSSTLNQEA